MNLSPKELIESKIMEKLHSRSNEVKQLNTTYKIVITGTNEGTWRIHCKDPIAFDVGDGDADCTLTMQDEHFVDVIQGRLNPQMAFMTGKLKFQGDMTRVMNLAGLL